MPSFWQKLTSLGQRKRDADSATPVEAKNGKTTRSSAGKTHVDSAQPRTNKRRKGREPSVDARAGTRETAISLGSSEGEQVQKKSKSKKSHMQAVEAEDEQMVEQKSKAKLVKNGRKRAPVEEDVEMVDAAEDSPKEIGTAGLLQLCEDAELPMDAVGPVLLAWQLGAARMGVFETDEFMNGLGVLSAYALNAQSARKKLHTFLFGFAKGDQRVVEIETALALLNITLARTFPLAKEICTYVQEKAGQTGYKSLTKDHWAMLWDFCTTVKEDLEGYKEEDTSLSSGRGGERLNPGLCYCWFLQGLHSDSTLYAIQDCVIPCATCKLVHCWAGMLLMIENEKEKHERTKASTSASVMEGSSSVASGARKSSGKSSFAKSVVSPSANSGTLPNRGSICGATNVDGPTA
ncbi:hypothetical protein DACRYDRAFT_13507 [Dacryopinax primogenitus]|uniref:Defective in cullin neddylation protein n=1 Tax=Dacryopinax primogenitus (strain DJM 731) TaxID=1858805 RepID=M5G9N9_DACPD|nr:uncharacterized protein DACRYDRAFT_13507 [Dacryopinax primogenitus]EJU05524.1 hypothetical protein DACRYDRAFT_13507 [Dacryopinax primogenitus]